MRKKIRKLFIVFGVLICIFALVGCDLIFVDNPDPEKNPAEESSLGSSDISEESTIESGEESIEETIEEKTEETWENGPIEAEGNELIAELLDSLDYYRSLCHDYMPKNAERKINGIKAGDQAFIVEFDADSYYFVCGYINPTHEWAEHYCCGDKYVWVRYKNESEIQEYYDGLKIAIAFQINKALFVNELLPSEKEVDGMEHYQLYHPEFADGYNVNSALCFERTFIYINPSSTSTSTMYNSTDRTYYYNYCLSCVYYKDQYYLDFFVGTKYYDGRPDYKYDYKSEYGNYSDAMLNLLIAEEGVARKGNTGISFYGLIPIDDFVNNVLK